MNTHARTRTAIRSTLLAALLLSLSPVMGLPVDAQIQPGPVAQAGATPTIEVKEANGLAQAIQDATKVMEKGDVPVVTIKVVGNHRQILPSLINAKGKIVITGNVNEPDQRPIITKSNLSEMHIMSPVAFQGVAFEHSGSSEMLNINADLTINDSSYVGDRGVFLKADFSSDQDARTVELKNNTFKGQKLVYLANKLGEFNFIGNTFDGGELELVSSGIIELASVRKDPGKVLIQDNTFAVKKVSGSGSLIRISRPNVAVRRNTITLPDSGDRFTAIEFMRKLGDYAPITNSEITLNSIDGVAVGVGNELGAEIQAPEDPALAAAIKIHKNCFIGIKRILPVATTKTKAERVFDFNENCIDPAIQLDNPLLKTDTMKTITKAQFDTLVAKSKEDDKPKPPPAPQPPAPQPQPVPQPQPQPSASPSDPAPAADLRAERLSGPSRVETAVSMSKTDFKDGADTVIIARADNHADSVAAIPLADELDAPILLTQPDVLHAAVAEELKRLKAKQVIVMGGPVAINEATEKSIAGLVPKVERIAGKNRADTAVGAAEALLKKGDVKNVLVADGADWQASLLSGPAAAEVDGAVLLTNGDQMAPETKAFIDGNTKLDVKPVGANAAKALPGKKAVVGDSASDLSVAVAKTFFTKPKVMGVATTADFADALTGGAHIARKDGPLFLLPEQTPSFVKEWMKGQTELKQVYVYGGDTRISAEQMAGLIK